MARKKSRARFSKPKSEEAGSGFEVPPIDANDQAVVLNERLIAKIRAGMKPDVIYSFAAPTQVHCLKVDGSYRTQSVNSDEEMSFRGARIGAKRQIIFEFTPIDPSVFSQYELDETKVFMMTPGFEQAVVNAIDPAVAVTEVPGYAYSVARAAFMKAEVERIKQEEQRAVEEAEKEARSRAEADPNWGIF